MSNLLTLRQDKRNSREKFLMQGITICYNSEGKTGTPNPSKILREAFPDDYSITPNELSSNNSMSDDILEKTEPRYKSIQVIAALMKSYNLEIILSDELPDSVTTTLDMILNGAYLSEDGYPVFHSLWASREEKLDMLEKSRTFDPFEIRMSTLELCQSLGKTNCVVDEDFLHELFISFYFTNRLRKRIPNFQLCYGGIKACSPNSSKSDVIQNELVSSDSYSNEKSEDSFFISQEEYGAEEEIDSRSLTNMLSSVGFDSEIRPSKSNRLQAREISGIQETKSSKSATIKDRKSSKSTKVKDTKNPKCACDSSQTVDYLILEKLPGESLSIALRTSTLKECLNWLLQISLSLELGIVHTGFTHYNLHPDNIQICSIVDPKISNQINQLTDRLPDKSKTGTRVKYWHRNEILLLEVNSLAIIKNFETAHVKHLKTNLKEDGDIAMVVNESEHFGALGYEHLGIFHNETRPFYDIYKLLFWMLYITRDHNPVVYASLKKASKFFGHSLDRNLHKTLNEESKIGFVYSVVTENAEKVRSLGEFISFLIQTFQLDDQLLPLSRVDVKTENITSLQCAEFCPLDGHLKSNDKVFKENPLRFLGLQGCLNRRRGLKKRSRELELLQHQFCNRSNESAEVNQHCPSATEELLDSRVELDGFEDLVSKYAQGLYQDSLNDLEDFRLHANDLIEDYNKEVDLFSKMGSFSEVDLLSKADSSSKFNINMIDRDKINRKLSMIKGKMVVLVRKLSTINEFAVELQLAKVIPNLEVAPINPLPQLIIINNHH